MLNGGKEFEKREGLKLYATMDTRELHVHVHVCSILVLVLHVDMYVVYTTMEGCGNYRNVYMYIYSIYTDSLIQ